MSETGSLVEFVHIEKTAGTMVRAAIEKNVDIETMYIYSPNADRFTACSENLQPQTSQAIERIREIIANPVLGPIVMKFYPFVDALNRKKMFKLSPELEIPENARVLFGHFTARQFDPMLTNEPVRAVMLRDPLERMKSHYSHWLRNRGHADWRVLVPYQPGMSFEDFAFLPVLQNYQDQAIDGVDLGEFELVGVTEDTETFIVKMLRKLKTEGITVSDTLVIPNKRLNVTPPELKMNSSNFGDEFIRMFADFHARDYDLYSHAKFLADLK